MKIERMIVTGFAVLALSTSIWAQSLTVQVRTTYDRFRTAVERFDTMAVREMLDPGFSLTLPSGQVLARAAYLTGIEERQIIGSGAPRHSFVLSNLRERNGFVTVTALLTLNSNFVDGNSTMHTLKVVERKTIRFKREGKALKIASIDALEIRTSIDGKTASIEKRK